MLLNKHYTGNTTPSGGHKTQFTQYIFSTTLPTQICYSALSPRSAHIGHFNHFQVIQSVYNYTIRLSRHPNGWQGTARLFVCV